jgi:hypothetical protein
MEPFAVTIWELFHNLTQSFIERNILSSARFRIFLDEHSKKNHLDLNTEPVSDSLQLTCVHRTQAPVFNFPFF